MKRRNVGEVLWSALQYAKADRRSFVEAYSGDKSVSFVREALRDIKAFEDLQVKLFGTFESELESKMKKMKVKSVLEMMKAKGISQEKPKGGKR